jgi:hypothetical protein
MQNFLSPLPLLHTYVACTECHAVTAPLPRQCCAVIIFFLERLIVVLEFLHITYTKTTILIKGPFGTPCGSHKSMQERCGSGTAAVRHSMHPA